MATKIIMPKLGMAMSKGKVAEWLKDDGAEVKKGEPVVVVMSEKITYEVEAPADGILRHVAHEEDTCSITEIIGFITAPGEEIPKVEVTAPAAAPAAVPAESKMPAPAAPAEEKAETPREKQPIPSSPIARRLARELGVDISKVIPSGRRITEKDVRRFYEEQEVAAATSPEAIPFVGMRRTIAERMTYSLRTMAQLTLTTKVDVTELKSTREALRVRWDRKVSYTDLLVKAVAVALGDHPLLGARLEGEEIVMPAEINIGVAVALEDGLIVPVVRSADRMTIAEIGDKIIDLAQRARKNALRLDEVTGAVFTVTNLGMYGIDAFTPIINLPEVAILGVGRITEEVALVNGQIAARSKMVLSLTIDHRIVDGAPGAAFLRTLVWLLENPALIFAAG